MLADLDWQFAIHGTDDGCGFAVTAQRALTCAHVVGERSHCMVRPLAAASSRQRPVERVKAFVAATDPWADIAVVDITGHPADAVAPLGPLTRPEVGTVVSVLGLPRRDSWDAPSATRDADGRRVRAQVSGTHAKGIWLQLDALHGHTAWIEPGFSGAAAVDEVSGRVVGMVVAADRSLEERTAWIIPLGVIAEHVEWFAAVAGDPLRADPAFVRFLATLDRRRYDDALAMLVDVEARHRGTSDVYYYWALTLLHGCRPAAHSGELIGGVERLLEEAGRLSRGPSGHARALLALVRDDYYTQRGLVTPRPVEARAAATRVDASRAREITRHVPAPECVMWQRLHRIEKGGYQTR